MTSLITDFRHELAAARTRTSRLPERLTPLWRGLLGCGDAAVMLFVCLIVFSSAPNWLAAALVMTLLLCGSFAICGLYKRSYAVEPRDEAYYACTGVLFAAVPAAAILTLVGEINIGIVLLSLLFCAIGTSAYRIRMHLQRRSGRPRTGINSITPLAWHDRESTAFVVSKRAFDIVVASAATIVTLPVMFAAAAAVFLDSGPPIFFRQERVGRNGRPFSLFKFRTMRQNAGSQWVRPGDQRITRIGAFLRRASIDELPQLFNVLRGDMSIVGPRPEMVQFAKRFANEIPAYGQRHAVHPGITGWAQMYCERNLTPEDVIRVLPCDLFYAQHASIVIDCAILLKTVSEVLFQRAV